MGGLNPTGTNKTDDYTLPRGKIYGYDLDSTNRPKGGRFLGNAPSVVLTMAVETLKHFASFTGLKVADKEVTLSQEVGVKLTLDEWNFENLSSFFSGETASYDNSAATALITGVANLKVYEQGRWYDIYKGTAGIPTTDPSGARLYDIGVVTIATKTEGVDFLIDHDFGRIFIIQGGAITGTVGGTTYNMVIAANASADTTVDEVKGLTKSSVAMAVKIITQNPAFQDFQVEYQIHKIVLRADGDLNLIGGDDWGEIGLSGTAERNETADLDSPTITIRTHSNAAA